jgi:two-component system response regulator HydG
MRGKASTLIVDDDPGMTETLFDVLEDMDFRVEIASDGFEAIDKVRTEPFDIIFLDIKMPGINGVETFKEIKAIRPEAAVMMMTAYSVEELVAEALEEGAYGVMYKPLDIGKVVEFIERITGSALILVVDDDLPTCETLIDILEEKKYRVTRASKGEEAIEKVRERSFDLAFIDVKMPVMNGLEIYLALKEIRPDIKVIMMTGYRQEVQDLVEEALGHNAYTCIYKPFSVNKLLSLIVEVLAIKKKGAIQGEVN